MIVENKDPATGIIRHEIGTASPKVCRKVVERIGGIRQKLLCGSSVGYVVNYLGEDIQVQSTETRTIFFCRNRFALLEYERFLEIDNWAYDDSTKNDYVPGRRIQCQH